MSSLSNVKWALASTSDGGLGLLDEESEGGRSMMESCAMRCVLPPRRSSSAGVRDARASGGCVWLTASWPFARSFLIDS